MYTIIFYLLYNLVDQKINLGYMFIVIFLGLFGYCFLGVRWFIHINLFSKKMDLLEAVNMEFISKFLNFISPFQLSIPFRSFYLKKHNIHVSNSLSLSFFDLANDLTVATLIILISSLFFNTELKYVFVIPFVVMVLMFLFVNPIYSLLKNIGKKINNKILKIIAKNLARLVESVKIYSKNPKSYFFLIISILFLWFIRIIRMFFIGKALCVSIPIYAMAFASCFSFIIGFLSRVPGGIGVNEISGMLILQNYVPQETALSIFLIERIVITSLVMGLGGSLFVRRYGTKFLKFIKKLKKTE